MSVPDLCCLLLLCLSIWLVMGSQSPGEPDVGGWIDARCSHKAKDTNIILGYQLKSSKWQRHNVFGQLCLLNSREFIAIYSFTLYQPILQNRPMCPVSNGISPVCYNQSNATCLSESGEIELKHFLLPFMEVWNGKLWTDVVNNQTDLISAQPLDSSSLAEGTIVSFDYNCTKENEKIILQADICQNGTLPEDPTQSYNEAVIQFNTSSYMASSHLPTCFCEISSRDDEKNEIHVTALDVRLQGATALRFHSGKKERELDSSQPIYWKQDGFIMKSTSPIEANLVNIVSNSAIVWLKVEGFNLTITCGMKTHQAVPDKSDTSYQIYIFIALGVLIGIVLLIVVIKCVYGKMRKRDEEDEFQLESSPSSPQSSKQAISRQQSSTHEPVYAHPHKSNLPADEGKTALLEPTNYFELEHQYEEATGPSNNNLKLGASSKSGYEAGEDSALQSGDQATEGAEPESVYNHLRERPDVLPQENLYDTASANEYASFKRNANQPVIDNIYNTCA